MGNRSLISIFIITILLSSCKGHVVIWDGFQLIGLGITVSVIIVGVMITIFEEIVNWIKGK